MNETDRNILSQPIQISLPFEKPLTAEQPKETPISSSRNSIAPQDQPFHSWYRFRDYIKNFGLSEEARILDPFCGTGTTIVEAKLRGVPSVGTEANPPKQIHSHTLLPR